MTQHDRRFALLIALLGIILLGACASPSPHPPGKTTPGDSPLPASRARAAEPGTASNGTEPIPSASSPESTKNPETQDATSDGESSDAEGDREKEKKDEKPERIVLDTVYDDRRVGADQTAQIEAELGLVDDPELNRFVRSVAVRLLRYAPNRPFDYEFKIVDQSVPNAFALPGGKIYVSRGLLALTTTEDELAGVLGHEITHAAERHAAARIDYSRRLNPFSIGLLRAARIAAYGREQELDADRGGQLLAAKAGYDPTGIASFLRKLDASERYKVGWARLPFFLATHPTSPERSSIALDRAATLQWTPEPGVSATEELAYLGVIDGLIIGDDPAGGLFDEENRFVHPELDFSIRFPQGWETMNTNKAVRALSPRRDAQATLTVIGGGEKPLEEIVDDFLEEEFEGIEVRVRERRELKVGELPAIRVAGRSAGFGPGLHVQMTFVRYNDLVYRLTVLSLPGADRKYRGRSHAFARSFRPLDEEGTRSLRVTRIRVARALENETLKDLSERTRNELEVVFTGVLNGIYASTPLEARTPVKIGIAEPYLPKPETDVAPGAESESEASP